MQSQSQGQVGPGIFLDGSIAPLRQERTGALVVTQAHGGRYEAAFRKNLFTAYCTGTTLTAVNTTYTGLGVYNGSTTVNLAIQRVAGFLAVTSASDLGVLLAVGNQGMTAPTGITGATRVQNNFLSAGGPQATPYTAATLAVAGTPYKTLLHNSAAIATTGEDSGFQIDLEGGLIVPPGWFVEFAAYSAASAASAFVGDIQWEEVPV